MFGRGYKKLNKTLMFVHNIFVDDFCCIIMYPLSKPKVRYATLLLSWR